MNTRKTTLAAGDLDPGFGENGIVFTHFGPGTEPAAVLGINFAPDDKLLICGSRGEYDYAVARLNIVGTPDTSFGNAGVVVGQFKAGLVSAAGTALVTTDQKLIVIGRVHLSSSLDYRALTRLNSDGSLDTSFGDQGSVILDLPLGKSPTESTRFARKPEGWQASHNSVDALLQADGKIVLSDSFEATAVTFRLNADGSLDTSFNGTGYATLSFPGAVTRLGPLYVENQKVTLAGNFLDTSSGDFRPMVVRYNPDGSLDNSFGQNGIVLVSAESTAAKPAQFLDVIRESNGNILGIGSTRNVSPLTALMVGLDTNGSMDPAFNDGKVLFTDIGGQGCQWNNAIADARTGLNVVCGGTLGSSSVAIVGRIDNQGRWDTGFGAPQGWVEVAVAPGFTINEDVVVQNDGKILVGGAYVASDGSELKGFVFRLLA